VVNRYDGLFPQLINLVFPDGDMGATNACDHDASKMQGDRTLLSAGQSSASRLMRISQNLTTSDYAAPAEMPVLNKNEFPISTPPENPLRYLPAFVAHRSGVDVYAREPVAGPWPLVARRVNGVGAMPYEKWGFSLLAGWSGVVQPSAVRAADQAAPKGTQWAQELGLGDVPVTNSSVSYK